MKLKSTERACHIISAKCAGRKLTLPDNIPEGMWINMSDFFEDMEHQVYIVHDTIIDYIYES